MGYRSDVSVTIKNGDFKILLEKTKAENKAAYDLLKCASVYRTEEFTTLHFEWVKWYLRK